MLKSGRGVVQTPRAKSCVTGYEIIDRKVREHFGKVPQSDILHFSKMFSNFSVEIFISSDTTFGPGCLYNTPATLEHSESIFQGGDSIGVSKPRFFWSNFEDQLPLRYWVSNNEWVLKKCGMDSGCPLKSTSTHNSHNSGSYERFSAGSHHFPDFVDLS